MQPVTRHMARLVASLVVAGVLVPVLPASAEPVRIVHDGRGLDGELALAPGKKIEDGVLIMVHGTLAHNRMEIMRALQETLGDRNISTLAVSLSLGLPDRREMYDCATPHRHGNAQAAGEIAAWVEWASGQGTETVGILGHSRGGTQVAYYAARAGEKLPAVVEKIILVAPTTFDRARAAREYAARFNAEFAPVLARAEALVAAGKGSEIMPDTGFMYCPQTRVAAATFADYHAADGRNDAPSLIGGIWRPVLVAIAGGDEVVPDLPQKLETAAKPGKYRAVAVDDADHFFQDLFGEDLADAIAEFWDE